MVGAELVGKGTVEGVIHVIDMNPAFLFPALVDAEGKRVFGEVYLVEDETLKTLDHFEGVSEPPQASDEYVRVQRVVKLENDEESTAWVWIWNRALGNTGLIESGDWLDIEPNPN
jgi:gamma-glutamylcyclotransferase (GGCT)/AIG2-like uncharacterized protein YtfP